MGKKSKKSESADDTVEILLPQHVIDEAGNVDHETVVSIVEAILGNYPLFGITKVEIRSKSAQAPEIKIKKC